MLSVQGLLTRKQTLTVPCPSFNNTSLMRRFKGSNILALGGYQSILIFFLEDEMTEKASLTHFYLIREIHSDYISDINYLGDSILVSCSKDTHFTEIKFNMEEILRFQQEIIK